MANNNARITEEQKRVIAEEISRGNVQVTTLAKAANISRKAARNALKAAGVYQEPPKGVTEDDVWYGRCTPEQRAAYFAEHGFIRRAPVDRRGVVGEAFTLFAWHTPERIAQGWELNEEDKRALREAGYNFEQ